MQKLIWLNLCWAAKSFVYSEYEEMTEGYFSVQGHIQGYFPEIKPKMLMTDVDDGCWWRMLATDVGDGRCRRLLETKCIGDNLKMLVIVFFTISATYDFTKILTLSPTFKSVINFKSATSASSIIFGPENGSLFHVLEYPSQNNPYNDSWNVKMIR